jgi:hypothetical protein
MAHKLHNLLVLALVTAALFCVRVVAQEKTPDWSKVQIKVTKVSGNIYMLEGQDGNIAASVGEDGIVIVDDEFAPLADNTHYHGDHAGGNASRSGPACR